MDRPIREYITKGLCNPRGAAQFVCRRVGVGLSSRGLLGTHVFERDWDVLVLLDTCRVDALRAVADEYPFLGDVGSLRSVGATSSEWIGATFDRSRRDELRETAYLAANGYADFILESGGDPEQFVGPAPPTYFHRGAWDFASADDCGRVEHLWRYERGDGESELGHDEGHAPPRYGTDRAIAVGREGEFDRLIVHYSQPHHPYVSRALAENRALREHERDPFSYLRGGGDRREVLKAYLADLRYVLDEVALLAENIDGDMVVSADHGEAFGELGVFGHPAGSLLPVVRTVPWARVGARDGGGYQPEFDPEHASERGVADQLEALGYVE